jgi:hypothetical protein
LRVILLVLDALSVHALHSLAELEQLGCERLERVSLRTPEQQAAVLERAVAGLLNGGQNARAGAAVIEGVKAAARLYENAELERRLRALECAK